MTVTTAGLGVPVSWTGRVGEVDQYCHDSRQARRPRRPEGRARQPHRRVRRRPARHDRRGGPATIGSVSLRDLYGDRGYDDKSALPEQRYGPPPPEPGREMWEREDTLPLHRGITRFLIEDIAVEVYRDGRPDPSVMTSAEQR